MLPRSQCKATKRTATVIQFILPLRGPLRAVSELKQTKRVLLRMILFNKIVEKRGRCVCRGLTFLELDMWEYFKYRINSMKINWVYCERLWVSLLNMSTGILYYIFYLYYVKVRYFWIK